MESPEEVLSKIPPRRLGMLHFWDLAWGNETLWTSAYEDWGVGLRAKPHQPVTSHHRQLQSGKESIFSWGVGFQSPNCAWRWSQLSLAGNALSPAQIQPLFHSMRCHSTLNTFFRWFSFIFLEVLEENLHPKHFIFNQVFPAICPLSLFSHRVAGANLSWRQTLPLNYVILQLNFQFVSCFHCRFHTTSNKSCSHSRARLK